MKKILITLLLLSFSFSAFSSENLYWSNKKTGPFNINQAKEEFGNRPLYSIEGIWFDDGLGTIQIIKDWDDENKFKMFIIDIGNTRNDDFNGTWEATFFQNDINYARYSFFSRVWYGSKENRFFSTQSGYAQINADTNYKELLMDYDSLSQGGRNMDHTMRRVWPADFESYNDEKLNNYKKLDNQYDLKENDANNVSKTNKVNLKSYWWVAVLLAVGSFFIYMITTKDLPQIKKKKNTLKKSNIFSSFFRGEQSLVISYWLFYTLGGVVGALLILFAEAFEAGDGTIILLSLAVLIYTGYAMIGTWRSAENYKKEKKKKKEGIGWAITAQVLIVLAVIRVIVEFTKAFSS